ncbi:transcriptional repressor DicA [Sodalis glossinidius str. 'morsitans']|uniref:Transcriptional repressor DicA n=1 Tax=Sodalis glossinidius (strain morsitans) TaxID=343509 RepID=A0A193QM54_SODGM|nr:helix-turn-helix domain-containing protein [Sodalis glossinidius]CRL46237.1 transcriptional repressor DicA [Sodalis glossinidius str. 'morsitans']
MKEKKQANNPLAMRLNKLIETKSVSKSDMAKICGVTPQSVNSWFVRGSIGKDSAMKLSETLRVSVAWLLGERTSDNSSPDVVSPPETQLSPREKFLLNLFNELPEDDKEQLIESLQKKQQYYNRLFEELARVRDRKIS